MYLSDVRLEIIRRPTYNIVVPWKNMNYLLNGFEFTYGLNMFPEYRREDGWTLQQKINYIEHRLCGGSSGINIYFNSTDWSTQHPYPIVIVDGTQRIETVQEFMRNEIAVFEGNKFTDFCDTPKMTFIFHINELDSYSDVLRWYEELNAVPVPRSEDDINKVKRLIQRETEKENDNVKAMGSMY